MVIESMASQGKEPTFCMGDDIPLAVLSQRPHLLYDYFKQRFAQVSKSLHIFTFLTSQGLLSPNWSLYPLLSSNSFLLIIVTVIIVKCLAAQFCIPWQTFHL
jgi:hypothetical protein